MQNIWITLQAAGWGPTTSCSPLISTVGSFAVGGLDKAITPIKWGPQSTVKKKWGQNMVSESKKNFNLKINSLDWWIINKSVSEVLYNLGRIYLVFTGIHEMSRAGFLTAFREVEDLPQVTVEPESGVPMSLHPRLLLPEIIHVNALDMSQSDLANIAHCQGLGTLTRT